MSLNSIQIYQQIIRDNWGKKHFLGVFAYDRKPKIKFYPSSLILNNQNHNEPGQHWIALFFLNKNECEFFDSLANNPCYYKIQDYIKKYSNSVTYLTNPLQHQDSYYCGYYCIYFIQLRSRNFSLIEISQLLKTNSKKENDKKIKNILN